MAIALVGYRGTGKTTVARLLALRLSWDWVDADVEVELAAGKSIAAIFADEGETRFRDLESSTLARLCGLQGMVVAAGGGAVLRSENREVLGGCDAVCWLQADADALFQRIQADAATAGRRPNLTSAGGRDEIVKLLAQREPLYRACADMAINTQDQTPQQVADAIAQWWLDRPAQAGPL